MPIHHSNRRPKPLLPPLKAHPTGRRERGVAGSAEETFTADAFIERVYSTLDRKRARTPRKRVFRSLAVVFVVVCCFAAAGWQDPRFREYVYDLGQAAVVNIPTEQIKGWLHETGRGRLGWPAKEQTPSEYGPAPMLRGTLSLPEGLL